MPGRRLRATRQSSRAEEQAPPSQLSAGPRAVPPDAAVYRQEGSLQRTAASQPPVFNFAELDIFPQEVHLPHEAWHVVQQKQGRVKPTLQAKGLPLNHDGGLEREAESMGARALNTRASLPMPLEGHKRIAEPERSWFPGPLVIQRALSYATPVPPGAKVGLDADLGANRKDVVRFDHGETLTNTSGDGSDTGNFTHANDSDLLENADITWGAKKIGVLRPAGKIAGSGNFDPCVKMHLVNSFLHPDANNWGENWVWGHGELNHAHDLNLERPAWNYHPDNGRTLSTGEAVYALSYRTEVTTKATAAAKTADDLADGIAAGLNNYVPLNWTGVNGASVKANVQIGGQALAAYHGRWQTAIPNTAARKVTSLARIYGIHGMGAVKAENVALGTGSVEANNPIGYRVAPLDVTDWLAGRGIITPPAGPRPKRSASTSGGGGKKAKTT